jgi:hypothetical protein
MVLVSVMARNLSYATRKIAERMLRMPPKPFTDRERSAVNVCHQGATRMKSPAAAFF